jgi:hypothetical protein
MESDAKQRCNGVAVFPPFRQLRELREPCLGLKRLDALMRHE